MKEEGLRYNEGKLRYDLLEPLAQEGLIEVMTFGSKKYAEWNWAKGMKWSKVLASMKRHIAAIEKGEDYDPETGLLHADHVQANAHFLSAYYRIAPHLDDRRIIVNHVKIALDIDEVLADFLGAWSKRWHITSKPSSWFFDRQIKERFEQMRSEGELDSFYLQINPLISAINLPFVPYCYITSRPVSSQITEQWLDMHGFPVRPVYTLEPGQTKAEVAKKVGIDVMVDDCYENWVELTKAGVFTYLFDRSHNQGYDIGHRRIKSLNDIKIKNG